MALQLLAYMAFQDALHDSGVDCHRRARCLFLLFSHLRRHQCRNTGRPGDPAITLLASRTKHQIFGPGGIHQHALFLLDRQLVILCLIDGQGGAGLVLAV